MIRLLPLIVLLAACGVDGAPIRPEPAQATKGVRVSGGTYFGYDTKAGWKQGTELNFEIGG